jgi:hypothetical protein
MRLATEAVATFESNGPSVGLVRALEQASFAHRNLGRHAIAQASVTRALEICEAIGDTAEQRRILVLDIWDRTVRGDIDGALAALDRAWSLPVAQPNPTTDIDLAAGHTDLLLRCGAPADQIEAAGQRGLDAAERWNLEGPESSVVRANVAEALLRAGHVDPAAGLIDPVTGPDPVQRRWAAQSMRVKLDAARGRLEEALAGVALLDPLSVGPLSNKLEHEADLATAELWAGRSENALERLLGVLDEAVGTDVAQQSGECLALAGRAAGDLAAADPGRRRPLLQRLQRLWAQIDFEPDGGPASAQACAATGEAELARLAGTQSVEVWSRAATEWDKLTRPFDAAYCRWRAAQVALAAGRATLAQRLLKRAGHDAREHAPLRDAIGRAADGMNPALARRADARRK